jgi:subtilisin family serine protease
MKKISSFSTALCTLSLLVGCGGGGVDLSPTPTPPTISSASKTVMAGEDASLNMTVSGTGLTFNIASAPSHGTAFITAAGVLTYTAAANTKATSDKLTVAVSNSAGSASAEMNFTVNTDPIASHQWHLINTGQEAFSTTLPVAGNDLNMKGAWASGVTGKGVIVNVVDTGLEIAHPDLAANVTTGSMDFGGDNDPTNDFSSKGDHGTSVAGLIASVAGNGLGGKGVAYGAKLMGHNFLGGPNQTQYQTFVNLAKAYGGVSTDTAANAAVFNASYGKSGCSFYLNATENSIYSGVKTLRNGKGSLVVKPAGNGFGSGGASCTTNLVTGISNANAVFDGANTVDNLIVVAAVNANGVKSSYSTTGANIWLSGFGGEYGWNSTEVGFDLINTGNAVVVKPAMVTTDQSGCSKGYHTNKFSLNGSPKSLNEFEREGSAIQTSSNLNCNYTSTFNGTSSAAPTVSGVVALILEARPELTWRDVKHILAKTAKKVDSSFAAIVTDSTNAPTVKAGVTVEQAWVRNNAGFNFHNWYGFGLVDATAAVSLAKTHSLLGSEKPPEFISASNTTLSFDTPITFQAQASTTAETVTFKLNLANANRTANYNCLQFELTSPARTTSILLNGGSGSAGSFVTQIEFLSNAFYGEDAAGTWSLLMKNICTSGTASFPNATPQLTIRGR